MSPPSRTRHIYIASALSCAKNCRSLATLLQLDGHKITSTWHLRDIDPKSEAYLSHGERNTIVNTNLRDMRDANTLVLLYDTKCRSSLVETGLAISWGYRVVLVGAVTELPLMLFQHDVRVVQNVGSLLEAL